jgi:hypothetical protein
VALFPSSVAYVWHAGRYASTRQDSLTAAGFDVRSQIIRAQDRFALCRGHLSLAAQALLRARERASIRHPEARGAHAAADREQLLCRPCRLRAVQRLRTTIIAAEISGRSCHAIDLLGQHVDVAIERWEAFTGEQARLDGPAFTEVAAVRRVKP